jgi:hypothetical protein
MYSADSNTVLCDFIVFTRFNEYISNIIPVIQEKVI